MIESVSPGSAADQAGLKVADVIVAVDGDRVRNAIELRNAIGMLREGKQVALDYYRDGKLRKVSAVLGSQNELAADTDSLHPGLRGATFANLSDNRATADDEGVLVVSVDQESRAAESGLEPGDVITRVNRKRVSNLEQFRELATGQQVLMLTVLRGSTLRLLRVG
jgi:serine protease Do/serine protease DegQ